MKIRKLKKKWILYLYFMTLFSLNKKEDASVAIHRRRSAQDYTQHYYCIRIIRRINCVLTLLLYYVL